MRPRITPAGSIPDDPRPQLGELVRRVPAGEHVEHVLELLPGQLGERVRALDELVQVVDRDLLVGADRHDLLRDDVERVAGDRGLLDRALAHRLRDDRALEQVGTELGEDPPLRGRAELVARAPDTLEPPCDRLRALDLDHEVDRAHVDPELEARGGDEARDPARLQVLLDQQPLLARQRAVVRARDLALPVVPRLGLGELVDPQRQSLGQPAVVDEDDRRAVRTHELEQRRVDRRPDRALVRLVAGVHLHAVLHHRLRQLAAGVELAQVLDRDDDLEVELLALTRVHEGDLPARARDEAADLRERALRRGEADALEGLLRDPFQAFEREREVRAALRARDRVHLVEDHRLDGSEELAAPRGEEQEERLGGRDQDVRRLAQHLLPLALRGVARADADRELRAQAGEWAAEVALDVVVQRLERRDVEEPEALARGRVQPVDADEEGGEGLARAGRRLDEHVAPAPDRRPRELLRRRRAGEGSLEPGPRPARQSRERIHPASVALSPGSPATGDRTSTETRMVERGRVFVPSLTPTHPGERTVRLES